MSKTDIANQSPILSHLIILPNIVLQAVPFAILILSKSLTSWMRAKETK